MRAQRCGLTQVAVVAASRRQSREAAGREPLRAPSRDAPRQRDDQRRTPEARPGFAPLLRWVVALLPPTGAQIALVIDAATLGQRCTVRSIRAVSQGCALPSARRLVRATAKGVWRPRWDALLAHLDGAAPADGTAGAATDRGLDANRRFTAIPALGGHPLRRINRQGKHRPLGCTDFRPLSQAVPAGGAPWQGRVTGCATAARQVTCAWRVRWDAACRDPG
ncbi:MAG: hypothetical protein NZ699_18565 [Roseiflexus sp.]|nr:hypothetical protein [Roseiflexus sp.]MCS7291126.1 hypothetical protein [Roseiflexus sp.]MDW8145872.1 hypothetical protein [Roseiflexaceae bacterium]MDW8232069.1 hypothetical protein [Roseiflexaceae bacterium]